MNLSELEITSHDVGVPGSAGNLAADLGKLHGGTMYIRRVIIIPAIVALGVAGSILSAAEMSVAVGHASSVHEHVVARPGMPAVYHHG